MMELFREKVKTPSKTPQLFLQKNVIIDARQGPRHGPMLLFNGTEDGIKATMKLQIICWSIAKRCEKETWNLVFLVHLDSRQLG